MTFSEEVFLDPIIPDALFNAVINADSGDVLILSDGGVYTNSAALPVNVPLTIKTADGAALKAKIMLVANASDEFPENMIDAKASFSLKNIICSGQQDMGSPYSGRFINRGNIGKGKIHLAGVEVSRFQFVCVGGNCDTLIVENCLFNGNLREASSWGGTFDFLNDIVNYVKIRNNTFMFCIFGPFSGYFWASYPPSEILLSELIIDHNTFYNITGAHGPTTTFTRAVNVQITNNLYINGTFRPLEFFSDKYIDFPENADEIYPYSEISYLGPKGGWIIRASRCDTADTKIDMRNNNISFTSDVLASWEEKGLEKPWVYTNETKMAIIDTNDAWFEEELVFYDAPAVPMFAIDSIAAHCAIGNTDTAAYKGTTPYFGWDWWNPDMSPTFDLRRREDIDMRYNRDAKSYTAGDDGLPLGDLNWWREWISIEESVKVQPEAFLLMQNYPNPFNPSTTISYTLRNAADVKLTVYNSLGQKVKILVDKRVAAGSHSVRWDGMNSSGEQIVSGIYYYKLETGKYFKTRKMLLVH